MKKGTIVEIDNLVGFLILSRENTYIPKNVIDPEICNSHQI